MGYSMSPAAWASVVACIIIAVIGVEAERQINNRLGTASSQARRIVLGTVILIVTLAVMLLAVRLLNAGAS